MIECRDGTHTASEKIDRQKPEAAEAAHDPMHLEARLPVFVSASDKINIALLCIL